MELRGAENALNLRALSRSQIISFIAQLEENNYIECSIKGCRCITLTVLEMANHLSQCDGPQGENDLINCKYCPHGLLSEDALVNHIISNHPYASELCENEDKFNFVDLHEKEKTTFLSSEDFKEVMKHLWRIHIQAKGYVMCMNSLCHFVTCFIPQMESHFLSCSTEIWQKLAFTCDRCPGKTASLDELTAHQNECHPPDNNYAYPLYRIVDDRTKIFWKLSFKAFGASKCVSKHCKFVSSRYKELEEHYRYCRMPHVENHEVCSDCGAWLLSLKHLHSHTEKFHTYEKDEQIIALMSIDVHSPEFSWPKSLADGVAALYPLDMESTQPKPKRRRSVKNGNFLTPNPSDIRSKRSRGATSGDVDPNNVEGMSKEKPSFLEELGKIIKHQSLEEESMVVNITVADKSWTLEAPNLSTATEVISRRLPTYSVKKILAESMEDGARLLERSSIATKIECCSDRPYIPPKPLDFVLENVDTIEIMRKKFSEPLPVKKTLPLTKSSTDSPKHNAKPGRKLQRKPCTPKEPKKRAPPAKKPAPQKKSAKITVPPKEVSSPGHENIKLLPTVPKRQGNIKKSTGPPRSIILVRCPPPNGVDPLNCARVLKEVMPNGKQLNKTIIPIKISDLKNIGNLKRIINGVVGRQSQPGSIPALPTQQDGPGRTLNSRRVRPVINRNFVRITPPTMSVEKTYTRVKLEPLDNSPCVDSPVNCNSLQPPTIPPIFENSGSPKPIIEENPILIEDQKDVSSVNEESAVSIADQCIPTSNEENLIPLVDENEIPDVMENKFETPPVPETQCSFSLITFQLPILPTAKTILFGETNPISDYYFEMSCSQSSVEDHLPVKILPSLKTYGRKIDDTHSSRTISHQNSSSIVPQMKTPRFVCNYGIFHDISVCGSECDVSEPEPMSSQIEVKDEPRNCFNETSYKLFESCDIYVEDESPDDDIFISVDIGESVGIGLYNDPCPWEISQKNVHKKTDKNSNDVVVKNPYRSSKFRKNHPCDMLSNTESVVEPNILNGTNPCYQFNLNKGIVNEKIEYSKTELDAMNELTKFHSDVDGSRFVNEPLIYAVDKIIYDHPPKEDGSAGKNNGSRDPTNSNNTNASTDQSCSTGSHLKKLLASETKCCTPSMTNPVNVKCEEIHPSNSSAKSTTSECDASGALKRKRGRPTKLKCDIQEGKGISPPSSTKSAVLESSDNVKDSKTKNHTPRKTSSGSPLTQLSKSSRPLSTCMEAAASLEPNSNARNNEIGRRKRGRPSQHVISTKDDSLVSEVAVKEETHFSEESPMPFVDDDYADNKIEMNTVKIDDHLVPPSKKKRYSRNPESTPAKPTTEPSVNEDVTTEILTKGEKRVSSRSSSDAQSPSLSKRPTRKDTPETISCQPADANLGGKSRKVRKVKEIRPGVIVDYEEDSNFPGTSTKDVPGPRRSGASMLEHSVENDSPLELTVDESKPVVKIPAKRGRPPKKKLKPPGTQPDLNVSSAQGEDDQRFLYLPGDGPTSRKLSSTRIDFCTKLTEPHKIVECALCGESMTAAIYKKQHLGKHNHMCWLVGEEPMDLEDEKGLERFLYKVYSRTKTLFTCEICQCVKKSAQGFLSHRKFCGKTPKQRQEMMVSCTICSRILKPSSISHHMASAHAVEKPATESLSDIRPSAARCLEQIVATTADVKNEEEFIDESEENEAAEKDSWIRQAYTCIRRRVGKEMRSVIESSAVDDSLHCIIEGCDFTDKNPSAVIEHYKICDKEPLDSKCNECNFITNSEPRIINHIRMSHYNKSKHYANKMYNANEVSDVSEYAGTFIPYIKSGEMTCRSLIFLQPSLYWTHQLRADYFSDAYLFPEWEIDNAAVMKPLDELSSYLDLRDESMRIAFAENRPEWLRLRKFTSHRFENEAMIVYTGGIVRTLDWFPSTKEQYLAVSVGGMESERIPMHPLYTGRGHVQIWSAGTLDNFSETYSLDLKFEFAICHEYGEVWDVQCCPSGANGEKRLGLLALGTSSGKVPVYSVPLPEASSRERAILPDPVAVLVLGMEESHQVSRISWSKTKPHRFIAAGFTNGMVAIWELTTTSSLLRSGRNILPFKLFHPHFTIITGLSFSPVNEYYIVTACAEKSTKFWNLRDTSVAHSEFTRGLVTDVAWLQHWMSTLVALDDNYTTGSTTVAVNPIRNFLYQSQPLVTQPESCGMSISVNDWLNIFVCGYDNGQVVLSSARKHTHHSNDDRRKIFNALVTPLLHNFNPGQKEMIDCNSYSPSCKNFGIIFNHNFHVTSQAKIKTNPCSDLTYYPLNPVNKVSWNPNPNSFMTLATAFNSGFIVVNKILLPKNETESLKTICERLNK